MRTTLCLDDICALVAHAFRLDDVSLRTPGMVHRRRVPGHTQSTDLHLPAPAIAHDGCLVTLAHRVSTSTIVDATDRHRSLLEIRTVHAASIRRDVSISA